MEVDRLVLRIQNTAQEHVEEEAWRAHVESYDERNDCWRVVHDVDGVGPSPEAAIEDLRSMPYGDAVLSGWCNCGAGLNGMHIDSCPRGQ